jgi:hypothetical protein
MSLNLRNTTVDFEGEATNCERSGTAGIVCPVTWRKLTPSSVMFLAQGDVFCTGTCPWWGLEYYKSVCLLSSKIYFM